MDISNELDINYHTGSIEGSLEVPFDFLVDNEGTPNFLVDNEGTPNKLRDE